MSDVLCSCLQCQIRRAAFGTDKVDVASDDFETGLLALATLFGCVIATTPAEMGVKAMQAFVGGQLQMRAARRDAGDIATMDVAGHG